MAFIFVPNADGGFDEGDKQTNLDTGVEYIFTDGAWRPLGPKIDEQFPELDERYVNIDGDVMHGTLKFDHGEATEANILIRPNISNVSTSIYQLNGGALRLRSLPGENISDGSTSHISIGKNEATGEPETFIYHLQDPAGPEHGVNLQYLESYVADELENIDLSEYLPLTGGTLTGTTRVSGASFFVNNSAGDEVARIQETGFIRSLDMFRSQREGDGPAFQARIGSDANAEIRNNGSAFFKGTVNMNSNKITNVLTPTSDNDAANKSYVDQKISRSGGGGVPVGSIMIWMNSGAPDGWFKLQGANFDIDAYPLLHAYLQNTDSYVSGKLPHWGGHYPGEYGNHLAGVSLGKKLGQRTAKPNGGAPKSSSSIPNGNTRTFTTTGNTNAYSNGISPVSIDAGWDDVTRPKTVVVHYIIKHD